MSSSDRLNRQKLQDANRNLSEIDEEIENLEQTQLEIQAMARPEQRILDTQLLRLYIDTIPPFDGNSLVLHSYIESVRSTFLNFPDDTHHVTHNLILQAVKNKLKGRAQTLIASRTDLITWEGIETLLKSTFGDQRDLQYLTHQLTTMRPNKNERPYDFGLRLQQLRAVILTKINDDYPDKQIRDLQIDNYNNIAKTTFITKLPINVQTIVRIKNPESLEDALNYVLEEEEFQNFAKLQASTSGISQLTPKPTLQNTAFHRNTHNPNFNRNFNFTQNSHQDLYPTQRNFTQPQFTNNFSTYPHNQFPSQPINVQPRQVRQNFPTNRQTFGPSVRQNVWKPNPNTTLPKPTPMSGISHTTQQRPKPMSGVNQYLHNTETTDHVPQYDNQAYHDISEYDGLRYEDVTFFQTYQENYDDQHPEQEESAPNNSDQNDNEASNFMNAEPTPYPT